MAHRAPTIPHQATISRKTLINFGKLCQSLLNAPSIELARFRSLLECASLEGMSIEEVLDALTPDKDGL